MDFFFPKGLFFFVFAAIFAYVVYQIATNGFKGSVLGGKIVRTAGEVQDSRAVGTNKLRVHVVDRDGERLVGIEFSQFAFLSYSMTGLSISRSDAKRLADLIRDAAA